MAKDEAGVPPSFEDGYAEGMDRMNNPMNSWVEDINDVFVNDYPPGSEAHRGFEEAVRAFRERTNG